MVAVDSAKRRRILKLVMALASNSLTVNMLTKLSKASVKSSRNGKAIKTDSNKGFFVLFKLYLQLLLLLSYTRSKVTFSNHVHCSLFCKCDPMALYQSHLQGLG